MPKNTDYARLVSKLIEKKNATESESEKGITVRWKGKILYLPLFSAKEDYKTLKRWFSEKSAPDSWSKDIAEKLNK